MKSKPAVKKDNKKAKNKTAKSVNKVASTNVANKKDKCKPKLQTIEEVSDAILSSPWYEEELPKKSLKIAESVALFVPDYLSKPKHAGAGKGVT